MQIFTKKTLPIPTRLEQLTQTSKSLLAVFIDKLPSFHQAPVKPKPLRIKIFEFLTCKKAETQPKPQFNKLAIAGSVALGVVTLAGIAFSLHQEASPASPPARALPVPLPTCSTTERPDQHASLAKPALVIAGGIGLLGLAALTYFKTQAPAISTSEEENASTQEEVEENSAPAAAASAQEEVEENSAPKKLKKAKANALTHRPKKRQSASPEQAQQSSLPEQPKSNPQPQQTTFTGNMNRPNGPTHPFYQINLPT